MQADDNAALRELFEQDQADRRSMTADATGDWSAVRLADQQRRAMVEQRLRDGAVRTAADHYHAAMVFQHGETPADYWRAHELARRAADLGERRGRWPAAAYDRWLMSQGEPQKYGTQYQKAGDRFVLWEVDPTTTDAERAEWDVPPLAVARDAASRLGPRADATEAFFENPPIAALEVPGLRVEIKRWLGPPPPTDRPKPRPSPLARSDPMHAVPLPHALHAARLEGAYCATDASGDVVATWRAFPLKRGTLVSGWLDVYGPAPRLEPVEVQGAAAIRISASTQTPEQLVVRPADAAACWVLSGHLGREDLVRIARGLVRRPRSEQAVSGYRAAMAENLGPLQGSGGPTGFER